MLGIILETTILSVKLSIIGKRARHTVTILVGNPVNETVYSSIEWQGDRVEEVTIYHFTFRWD